MKWGQCAVGPGPLQTSKLSSNVMRNKRHINANADRKSKKHLPRGRGGREIGLDTNIGE